MSVSTPILMTPSEIWAWAAAGAISPTAAMTTSQCLIMR